ncbi:hypothetical protein ACQ5SP_03265 [Rhodovulum sp. YNF3179]|uniref:hypothetical protein n=1 Tax=Rhodovulum sp. YNF3179 TaxID=3425127 RepID=UPI003D34E61A
MRKTLLAATMVALVAPVAQAGPIENACNRSDRAKGDRALCGCIQDVADLTLDRSDQRMAAQFFKDPHRAQEIRQSDNRRHEGFWQRYRAFGEAAEEFCTRRS